MTDHNYCPEQFTYPARHLYAADSFLIAQEIGLLDMVVNTFMRASGESVGTFALESAIDELACAMGVEPLACGVSPAGAPRRAAHRHHLDRHSRPHSPLGIRGIGEIGITGAGAAIANAVYNATGVRVRSLPITLDKLL